MSKKSFAASLSSAPKQRAPASTISEEMTAQASAAASVDVRHIPLSRIYTETQIREVDQEVVLDYASSIRDSEAGQPEQPIQVWANPDGRFLVLFGEHRFQAQLHNQTNYPDDNRFDTIIALVKTGECPMGPERAKLQLQENLLHNPISPIEIALTVQGAMDAGAIDSITGAVKWLGLSDSPKAGTIRKELSQAMSLLKDPLAEDLIEQVKAGSLKVYKAKQELDRRNKEASKQEAEAAISAAKEAAEQRVKEAEEKAKKLANDIAALSEQMAGAELSDIENQQQVIADKKEELSQTQEVIAQQLAAAQTPEKKPHKEPAAPKRFSVEYQDAEALLRVLNYVANELGLEEIRFPSGDIKRNNWDSIIADRLPGILEEIESDKS